MTDLVQLGPFTPATFEIDPVCKMRVLPETAAGKYEYEGRTYYFCATRCLERFRANPRQFLDKQHSTAQFSTALPTPATQSNIPYTCPMHPEIRQMGPGSCPICGMALEPVEVTADESENPELTDMTRRFRVSASL